jgi:hypothetical protein
LGDEASLAAAVEEGAEEAGEGRVTSRSGGDDGF